MKHTKRKKNAGLKKITPFHIINGIFLSLLMISFNLFGNGLRDAFNPTTRGEDD